MKNNVHCSKANPPSKGPKDKSKLEAFAVLFGRVRLSFLMFFFFQGLLNKDNLFCTMDFWENLLPFI